MSLAIFSKCGFYRPIIFETLVRVLKPPEGLRHVFPGYFNLDPY